LIPALWTEVKILHHNFFVIIIITPDHSPLV